MACVCVCECARELKIVQMQLGAVLPDKINSTIPQVSGSGEALQPCRLYTEIEGNISLNHESTINKEEEWMPAPMFSCYLCVKPAKD